MKEFNIIEKYFKPLTNAVKAARALGDDVAQISLKAGEELVISKDMFVENVHFLKSDGAFKIASKLLRTNLSDLAAAGAKPLYYSLGFSQNKNTDEKFIREFAKGLRETQDEFGLCLIGGDTVSSKEMFYSITVFGMIKKDELLARNAAQDGDLIYTSGTIGDAALGLEIKLGKTAQKFSAAEKKYLLDRHFFPTPRINLGQKLLEKNLAKSAIDISDGLLADIRHLCTQSNLSADIYLEKIPFSVAAKKLSSQKKIELLSGGDDYELLFAINPKNQKNIQALSKALNLPLTQIGEFKKSADKKFSLTLKDSKNKKIPIKKFGYEHF